ncbi:MAG: hypothetical protein AB7N80_11355 [Bdellovibrionales bacterium]
MTAELTPEAKAEEFLKSASLYHLGKLPTESSHPQTRHLSDLLKNDLPQASRLLQTIDVQALMKFQSYIPSLQPMAMAIKETLAAGRRVFLCGCGATGRLSLSLEYLWRQSQPARADQVIGFMAGGDVALVHSLEGFEDFPEYGAQQLADLGFGEGDLLISSTEGGETPFVIGATEAALNLSSRKPFFLYCNPKEVLLESVERSKRVLQNPRIHNICLFVGPMALAGSTRMQASTVLQLAIGLTLFDWTSAGEAANRVGAWLDHYRQWSAAQLAPLIIAESDAYQAGDFVIYQAEDLAITVFTDTTERSPTFSLPAFNNQKFPRAEHSLSYIMIPSAADGAQSWQKLLLRQPRVLNWPNRNQKTTIDYLTGFDFGATVPHYRQQVLPNGTHHFFAVHLKQDHIELHFRDQQLKLPRFGRGLLFDHLLLKMVLNIHSTLLMGRLKRFESNFMTYVMPTNGKLVDRSTRYVKWLLQNQNVPLPSDQVVVTELFRQLQNLAERESVVLKTADALIRRSP